jgi:hypothetical protein
MKREKERVIGMGNGRVNEPYAFVAEPYNNAISEKMLDADAGRKKMIATRMMVTWECRKVLKVETQCFLAL